MAHQQTAPSAAQRVMNAVFQPFEKPCCKQPLLQECRLDVDYAGCAAVKCDSCDLMFCGLCLEFSSDEPTVVRKHARCTCPMRNAGGGGSGELDAVERLTAAIRRLYTDRLDVQLLAVAASWPELLPRVLDLLEPHLAAAGISTTSWRGRAFQLVGHKSRCLRSMQIIMRS